MSLLNYLTRLPRGVVVLLGTLLVVLLGVADSLAGQDLSFLVFYLAPIFLVSWAAGRWPGYWIAVASAVAWYFANPSSVVQNRNLFVSYWNIAGRLGMFLVIAYLVAEFKSALDREKALSRVDHLTGVANRRCFMEMLDQEVHRARRYGRPFTVVYIDIDDVKCVNDRLGHQAGDTLLRSACRTFKDNLRAADTVARLGGDEFGILLPETGPEAAEAVVAKLRPALLEASGNEALPVSFSAGVVTFLEPPQTADEAIAAADRLMYSVKGSGKNRTAFQRVGDASAAKLAACSHEKMRRTSTLSRQSLRED
jgi:diguanylate cyclase (GGDEF)-like protein